MTAGGDLRSGPARRSACSAAGSSGGCWPWSARQMGYRIVVLDPSPRCPTAQVADGVVVGALDDGDAARLLAQQVDVITPRHRARAGGPARRPPGDRAGAPRRRGAAHDPGPAGAEAVPRSSSACRRPRGRPPAIPPSSTAALARIGRPRSSRSGPRWLRRQGPGADRAPTDGPATPRRPAPRGCAGQPAVVEEVVRVRARDLGDPRAEPRRRAPDLPDRRERAPPAHPAHHARAGADARGAARARAEEIAVSIADALGHVGVMAVELFELADGRLLVNEHRAAHAQQRPLHLRRVRDLAVRAARARDLRPRRSAIRGR